MEIMILNLENFSNICFYMGLVALVVLLLKTFLPFDADTEVTGDFNTLTDTDSSFNLFSIDSILSFFMCFGWMGWWMHNYNHASFKLCMLVATISGLLGMFLFAFLFAQIKKLEFVPKNDLKELIDKTGKSYTKFTPKGNGQIQIEFNSKLATLDATSLDEAEINSFELIKVVKVENDIVYIQKA
jgi:membrane-bound ClpP family serine protease